MNYKNARRCLNHCGLEICGVLFCIIIGSVVCDASNDVICAKTDFCTNTVTVNHESIPMSSERLQTDTKSDVVETKKVSITVDNLMSGLIGALIVAILNWFVEFVKRKRERYSLLKAVRSECEFNLSIMDEIAGGIAQGATGSYKRVKSDFYLELRKISYQYHFRDDFYSSMARVSCDEDVLNSELDELQSLSQNGNVNNVLLRRTALCAVEGVKGSLSNLKAKVVVLLNQFPWALFFK